MVRMRCRQIMPLQASGRQSYSHRAGSRCVKGTGGKEGNDVALRLESGKQCATVGTALTLSAIGANPRPPRLFLPVHAAPSMSVMPPQAPLGTDIDRDCAELVVGTRLLRVAYVLLVTAVGFLPTILLLLNI